MKAAVLKRTGVAKNAFDFTTFEKPKPKPRDVIVQVKAIGMNPVDTKVRKNPGALSADHFKEGRILGWDGSGIVSEVGSESKLFKVGDEVYFAGAIGRHGSNAEFVAIDERIVALKPKSLNWEQSAAIPLAALTAVEGMEEQMHIDRNKKVSSDKRILVIAGAGGVGSFALQLAKRVYGFKYVVATASRPESIEFCKKMGADFTIDHNASDLQAELNKLPAETGLSNGFDYVFNANQIEKLFDKVAPIIKPFGHITNIVETNVPLNMGVLMGRRITFSWEAMFTRTNTGIEMEKQGEILAGVAKLLDQGVLEHRVTKVYSSVKQLIEAHEQQETSSTIGKLVITANFDW